MWDDTIKRIWQLKWDDDGVWPRDGEYQLYNYKRNT